MKIRIKDEVKHPVQLENAGLISNITRIVLNITTDKFQGQLNQLQGCFLASRLLKENVNLCAREIFIILLHTFEEVYCLQKFGDTKLA